MDTNHLYIVLCFVQWSIKKWRSTSNELSFFDICSTFSWRLRFMGTLLFFLAVLVSLETETWDFDDLTFTLFTDVYCLGFPFLPLLCHCCGWFVHWISSFKFPVFVTWISWCNMQITWAQLYKSIYLLLRFQIDQTLRKLVFVKSHKTALPKHGSKFHFHCLIQAS